MPGERNDVTSSSSAGALRACPRPGACATGTSCCWSSEAALGGRLRSVAHGEYWLNLGAHLFPGPGSRVEALTRELGPSDAADPRSQGGGVLRRPCVQPTGRDLPARAPADWSHERVALARAGLTLRRGVRAWQRAGRPRPGEPEPVPGGPEWAASRPTGRCATLLGPLPERVDGVFRAAGRRAAAELDEQTAGVGLSLFGALWSGGARSTLTMQGGSGRLGEEVAARLGPAVEVGATATSVRPERDHVTVAYRDGSGRERTGCRRGRSSSRSPRRRHAHWSRTCLRAWTGRWRPWGTVRSSAWPFSPARPTRCAGTASTR